MSVYTVNSGIRTGRRQYGKYFVLKRTIVVLYAANTAKRKSYGVGLGAGMSSVTVVLPALFAEI